MKFYYSLSEVEKSLQQIKKKCMFQLAGFCQPFDGRIMEKLKELVTAEDISNVADMKNHLSMLVKNDLCPGQVMK